MTPEKEEAALYAAYIKTLHEVEVRYSDLSSDVHISALAGLMIATIGCDPRRKEKLATVLGGMNSIAEALWKEEET